LSVAWFNWLRHFGCFYILRLTKFISCDKFLGSTNHVIWGNSCQIFPTDKLLSWMLIFFFPGLCWFSWSLLLDTSLVTPSNDPLGPVQEWNNVSLLYFKTVQDCLPFHLYHRLSFEKELLNFQNFRANLQSFFYISYRFFVLSDY
jgi:hypothetical protein